MNHDRDRRRVRHRGVGADLLREHHLHAPSAGEIAPADPWDGRSLEWSIPSPPPEYNFAEIPVVEARDDWWHRKYTEDADGRLVKLPSGGADDGGDAVATPRRRRRRPTWRSPTPAVATAARAGDHGDGHGIHMPSPSFYPLVARRSGSRASATPRCSPRSSGSIPGLVLLLFGIFAWGLEPGTEPEEA